ncbi:BTAD domain-containing putative transcriptional regulator [Microlunatus antarcticus]|uniref:Putative ATPase/DNA-binding SARP family transcriptional activator n=1 Tax=Microlunatus antarcticus TaxID=53388 RepID=A0A7W5JTZ5_9ACTN|nr:putative ATPase/DNA-binding SARP family transcriptional activator [Microlunatus antarcticus]
MSDEAGGRVRVGLLGPLLVLRDGVDVTPAGVRLRALLCRLAVDAGRRVSHDELVDAVWPDGPPAEPTNALQSLVSRLRRALGDAAPVVQEPSGYRLVLAASDVDTDRLRTAVVRGDAAQAAGELGPAARAYAEALALGRGEPLVDAGPAAYAAAHVARWDALRLAAARGRAACALASGDPAAVVDDLVELVAAHPLDERLRLLLMRALAATGRSAEALAAYEDARRVLAEELGTDPGRELAALHLRLLRGEVPAGPEVAAARPAAPRSNLPGPRTSFVGREDDLDRVLGALDTSRLVTVVGSGGAGKTRLAVEAAARWLGSADGSAWLVELAPVTEPAGVADAALAALGLRDARVTDRADRAPQDATERLVNALRERRCLLVVDNCEHLVDAAAELVDRVLRDVGDLRVLVTSRMALTVDGEVLVPLAPLPLPPVDVDLGTAAAHPAVRLWLDRAAAVAPGFVLDAQTLGPVVEIVRRLDGLPLAIELAAARLGVLPVADVAQRLSDRFRLLTGGSRAGLPRHRTLRAVVGWSWDLLSPAERLLAERLAVFPAGTDVETAVAVCADDRLPADEVDALLLALVEKSLLRATEADGRLRLTMLETLREYGTEQLLGHGELDRARATHAAYFTALVERPEPVLRGPDQLGALDRLGRERENVAAALRYLVDAGEAAAAQRMCLALVWYWTLVDGGDEATTWLRAVVEASRGPGRSAPPEIAYAEAGLAVSEAFGAQNFALGGWTEARTLLGRLADRLVGVPAPFPGLAVLRATVASFAARPDLVERFVAEAEDDPDPWVRAAIQSTVASIAENSGDVDGMRRAAVAAYDGFRVLGDRWGLSSSLLVLAALAVFDSDLDAAEAAYAEALRHIVALGSAEDDLYLRIRLADLQARQGQVDRARATVTDFVADPGSPRMTVERELVAEAVLVGLDLQAGRADAALAGAGRLRQRLAERPLTAPLDGHLSSICLGTTATVEALAGDPTRAAADLASAYPTALGTHDMPIMATVGVAVAALALARAEPVEAATVLGAAARVRGADDPTEPTVLRLTTALRDRLGDAFDPAYAAGWTLGSAAAVARLDPQARRA